MGFTETGIGRNELKILYLDLELAYGVYYAFPSKRPQYLSASQLKQYQFCVCASWCWEHAPDKVHNVKITDDMEAFKKSHTNDAVVAKAIHKVMSEADVIVAHNGVAFDLKHANSMFIRNGLGPIPEHMNIDTLKAARKYFAFEGNSLGDLLERFNLGAKDEKPDWQKLTDGDIPEIKKAAKYCDIDVIGLRKVFLHIRPFIRRIATAQNTLKAVTYCDCCGSKRLINHGSKHSHGIPHFQILCKECGHWHKSKKPFVPEPEIVNYKIIKKCKDCGSKKLHNKGKGFDVSPYFRIKCSDCGSEHKGSAAYVQTKCKKP